MNATLNIGMSTDKADIVLFNANVITMDPVVTHAQMVACKDAKILGIGTDNEKDAFIGDQTTVIDCHGKTIVPGFHDAHMHLFSVISSLLSLDCSPAAVSSIVDIQKLVAQKAMETPPGEWIKGAEYNKFYLEEGRHPTRWDLDKAAPVNPVKLTHRTRYACVLNSQGLALAGINSQTPDPPGGLIDREIGTGEPTGLLFGMNAYLSKKVIPPPDEDEFNQGIEQANHIMLSAGITSLQEATVHNDVAQWDKLQKTITGGSFNPRVTMMFGFDSLEAFQKVDRSPNDEPGVGAMKIVIDEISGSLNPTQPMLNAMVLAAHSAGFQIAIHAIEDATLQAAIIALEQTLKTLPKNDHRHRIEHCSECPDHLLERLATTGAMVVTQPAFIFYSGERYLAEVEIARQPWLYRIAAWHGRSIPVAAGSDAPVITPDPLIGIYAAVTRKAENGATILPEEAVTPEQALWMYTMGGAHASFQDGIKGSITRGKLADMVILSDDPTSIPVEQIRNIMVDMTIIGGEVVWEREEHRS